MMVGTVLVVEDEPLILLDVETALHEAGFEVMAVTDAVQALAAFDAEPWQVQGPDHGHTVGQRAIRVGGSQAFAASQSNHPGGLHEW